MPIVRMPSSPALGLGLFLAFLLLLSACEGGVKELLGDIITPTPTETPSAVDTPAPLDLGQRDQGPYPEVTEGLDAAYAQQIFDLSNEARQANGLPALSLDTNLELAAAGYAQVLAVNDWWDHVGPDGSTFQERAEAAGYQGWLRLAENLIKGTGLAEPSELVDAWLASPGHRQNILNGDLEEMGVACYFLPGQPPRFWCVQEFGTQREPTPTPTPQPTASPTATATPSPAPTATPTATPSPTPTPTATPSPTPTATPGP